MVNPHDLWQRLWCGDVLALILAAAILGALGSVAHAMAPSVRAAGAPAPAPTAWWRQALVGAIAAMAMLWGITPETAIGFVSGSLLAGFAGRTVTGALEARLAATLAQEVAAARGTDLQRALTALESVERELPPPGVAPIASVALSAAAKQTLRELRAKYPRADGSAAVTSP
jgi:hypothetical protein